jgi:hypothetical protein
MEEYQKDEIRSVLVKKQMPVLTELDMIDLVNGYLILEYHKGFVAACRLDKLMEHENEQKAKTK